MARRTVMAILPPLLVLGCLLIAPPSADAATITVTGTGNNQVGNDGICTLVEALNNANSDALNHPDCLVSGQGGGIVDTIRFQIPTFSDFGCNPSTRVCTIVTEVTYQILGPVTIDGYTQTNTSPNTLPVGNNAVIRIRLIPANGSVQIGLRVGADDVTIRGLAIGGYPNYGILADGANRTRIIGCFVGINPDGVLADPNGLGGILLKAVGDAVIGGTAPADRNVISGNASFLSQSGTGIFVDDDARRTTIQGNYIGTNAAGTTGLGNDIGIFIEGDSTTVGGTTAGARNVISGNTGRGIVVGSAASDASANVVQGNFIGYDAAGTSFVGNGSQGIRISSGQNTTVGGTEPGAGNRIGGNAGAGVSVLVSGTGNRILGNGISSNNGLGIDLNGDNVTPNDLGDGDLGPNSLQNFPILTSVGVRANTTVHGTLNSTPIRTYRIELFSNTVCDALGFGEGETFLGFFDVATDGAGNASFVGAFSLVPVGRYITATATDLTTNDTSEFSACHVATQTGFVIPPASFATTEVNEGQPWNISFDVGTRTRPTANVTVPVSVSDATEGRLVSASTLTFLPSSGSPSPVIQLLGVDDGIDDGDVPYAVVLGPATSADPNYNGLDPTDVTVTNIDNDSQAAQCGPRPKVNVSVVKLGNGQQLRATVTIGVNTGTQNELVSIAWTRFDTATVVLDGFGPVQAGQVTPFSTPLRQSASFVITRTPGAPAGTVRLTVTDGCGDWPTFVGGGPNGW